MRRESTRRAVLAGAGAAAAGALAGCGGSGGDEENLTWYHADLAAELSKEMVSAVTDNDVAATLATAGSQLAALGKVDAGDGGFAVAAGDLVTMAWRGSGVPAVSTAHRKLRGVAALYPLFVTIVARPDAEASTLADLAGETVDVGAADTRRGVTARRVVTGVDADLSTTAVPTEKLGSRLKSGDVDASILMGEWPLPAVADLAPDVQLLGLADDARQKVAAGTKWLLPGRLPAAVYAGQDHAIPTVATKAVLVTRRSMPNGIVTRTTQAIVENAHTFTHHPSYLPAKGAKSRATRGLPIDLHGGADEYLNF
ncbi:MAG: TAXI family TRAP transporter solute-binding subunit [Haloarculaceae archaeon]